MGYRVTNTDYIPHGQKVVRHVTEHEGLVAFERMWRQHFLDSMEPKFLPALWSVNHSHLELESLDLEMEDTFCHNDEASNKPSEESECDKPK